MKNINKILLVLLIALIGLCIPSSLMAAAAYFLGKNVWGWFFITGAVTAVIGWLWNMVIESRTKITRDAIESQNKMADAFSNIETSCAFCQARNIIRVALGKDNKFVCKNCNNENIINIQFSTARVTTPAIADKTLNNLFKKLDEEPSAQSQSTVNTGKIEIVSPENEKK
ncbi:MAG: hypothetical protein JSW62_03105 [Thermoplasmatales archaeon]|nr:MAG: hypothetical protein JSW62_03105 [Thermoplasmatales archaeon]